MSTPIAVAFSGGIDSTALALTMPEAIPIFTDTGWEFPAVYDHLDRFEQVTGREVIRLSHCDDDGNTETLPDYIRRAKFFPNHRARYCTRMFKIDPINAYLGTGATLAIGLRADETERVGNLSEGVTIVYPLQDMNFRRIDCIRTCIAHDLLPRYPVYMARGGCVGCFYKRASEIKAMIYLAPDEIDGLIALEEEVQDERGEFFYMFGNLGMSLRAYRKQVLAQSEMFAIEEVYASANDRSEMGASCGAFCNR